MDPLNQRAFSEAATIHLPLGDSFFSKYLPHGNANECIFSRQR